MCLLYGKKIQYLKFTLSKKIRFMGPLFFHIVFWSERKTISCLYKSKNMSRNMKIRLEGQCHEIFCFRFFSWIIFPQASQITLGSFRFFFWKFTEILGSQGAPPVSMTPVAICHQCQRHRRQICRRCHWWQRKRKAQEGRKGKLGERLDTVDSGQWTYCTLYG